MRIGYFDCFAGISGDMLLGALVDAGVPFAVLEEAAAALNVGARLEMRKVSRGGLAGTKVDVVIQGLGTGEQGLGTGEQGLGTRDEGLGTRDEGSGVRDQGSEKSYEHHSHEEHAHEHRHADGTVHSHPHSHEHSHESAEDLHEHGGHESHSHQHGQAHSHGQHRSLSTILSIIEAAPLAEGVKRQASRAFQLLGEAEAAIHQMPIEQVHFHEVGAVDTIVDIVCTAAGCAALGVDRWMASPLNVGSGTVECAHGTLPVPAPATLKLLGDAPVYAAGPAMERVTPTGAAILRMLEVEYAALPAMRISASGYGAGGRDTPGQPNLLRLLVGEEAAKEAGAESIAVMETVIDDSSPQLVAYVSDLLLEAGAWDVYRVSVQMKKGRTGVQLTVLCHPDRVAALRDVLFRETTTIGMHWRVENKTSLAREFAEVQTLWGAVRIKIARWAGGEVANAAPEYEDCRKIAVERGVPLKTVMQEAMRVYVSKKEKG